MLFERNSIINKNFKALILLVLALLFWSAQAFAAQPFTAKHEAIFERAIRTDEDAKFLYDEFRIEFHAELGARTRRQDYICAQDFYIAFWQVYSKKKFHKYHKYASLEDLGWTDAFDLYYCGRLWAKFDARAWGDATAKGLTVVYVIWKEKEKNELR